MGVSDLTTALLLVSIACVAPALAWWVISIGKKRRRELPAKRMPTTTGPTQLNSPAKHHNADRPESVELARVLAAIQRGGLTQRQIREILDQCDELQLPPEVIAQLRESLSAAGPRLARCKVCGAVAIPGDDMCYTHHTK